MGETIKNIEVIAYKGMEIDMTCKGFQYEVGKTYKTDKVKLCEYGFHACLNPLDVLDYYFQEKSSRYFKVKLSGKVTKCDISDTKVAATEITILEEITIDELNNIAEWWKHENVLDLLYYSDGLAKVKRRNGEWNFIDKKGKILIDEWFSHVWLFIECFAVVKRSDKLYNFIDTKGKILSNEWFNWVGDFHGGLAKVQRSDKQYNFIDKDGKPLSNEWFNYLNNFSDGFAAVQRANGECAKIDKTGTLIKIQ